MFSLVLRIIASVLTLLVFIADAAACPDRPVADWLMPYELPISFGLHVFAILSGIIMIILSLKNREHTNHWLLSLTLLFIIPTGILIVAPFYFEMLPDYLSESIWTLYAVLGFSMLTSALWFGMATYPFWSRKPSEAWQKIIDTFA